MKCPWLCWARGKHPTFTSECFCSKLFQRTKEAIIFMECTKEEQDRVRVITYTIGCQWFFWTHVVLGSDINAFRVNWLQGSFRLEIKTLNAHRENNKNMLTLIVSLFAKFLTHVLFLTTTWNIKCICLKQIPCFVFEEMHGCHHIQSLKNDFIVLVLFKIKKM